MNELLMGATWADVTQWIPPLLRAFMINLQVTCLTLLIGLPGGLAFALLTKSNSRTLRWLSLSLVELGRGAPALVLVQFVYYGLPQVSLTLSSFAAAVAALAISTACYTSEIIRSSLDAVPQGQREASQALNMSRWDTLRFVILPQAARISTPALMGFAILVLQSTTLCFAVAMPEVVANAYEIGSISFQYFPVLLLTTAIFIVICVPASGAVGWFERVSTR